ncbi:unnamed protein product [Paramecium pentaurelia]|uniref:Uncharacterized protein n=1 Tax=Paramecium pentaurelia TaxID=43138 RepID=A0A8S1TIR7_9CILI|nr:unnamed protein product [Paramecium pentaurelia]
MKIKKIFPANTQNQYSVIQYEQDSTTVLRLHQSTYSKPQLSLVPSEASQNYYQIIEKNKLQYLEYYTQFNEMRFMENMAGLKSKQQKQVLLENFLNMFEDMISCLMVIQNTLLLINFDNPDFSQTYSVSPNMMVDILFKDIKTLEGLHLEIQYASSLRYLETVLEALEFNSQLFQKIHQLDVKQWSQKCNNYLNNFTIAKQQINNSQRSCCCFK